MKKVYVLIMAGVFTLGIAVCSSVSAADQSQDSSKGQSWDSGAKSDSSQGSGGASGGSSQGSPSMKQGAGGTSGGAASSQDLSAVKKDLNTRLSKVNKEIDGTKKNMKKLSSDQKDTMQLSMDRVTARRDAVKKMISDLKSVNDRPTVESAMADLEQSATKLNTDVQSMAQAAQTQKGGAAGGSAGSPSKSQKQQSGSSSQDMQKSSMIKTGDASQDKSAGGATGGSSMDMNQSTMTMGGATGAAAGQDVDAIKKDMNKRLESVDKELDSVKKNMGGMSADQKDKMQLQLDQATSQRDSVKKMISDMKSPDDQSMVEKALMSLEQTVKQLSSSMMRTTPAGETKNGGATGGSSMDMNQSTGAAGGATGGAAAAPSMGGATGGAIMDFSYDQRDIFKKTEKTKLDGLQNRIDMLRTNAKNSPSSVNQAVLPKVDQLQSMSNDVKSRINKIDQSDRQAWSTTKATIQNNITELEQGLMDAEKSFR